MEANTMSAILTNIGTFVTEALTWVGDVLGLIVSEPILLIGIGLMLFGACIGYVGRLLGIR